MSGERARVDYRGGQIERPHVVIFEMLVSQTEVDKFQDYSCQLD